MTNEHLERMVWVDVETFGLEPETDPIIGIGFKITDCAFRVLSSVEVLAWSDYHEGRLADLTHDSGYDNGAKYVLEMHTSSNLFVDARAKGRSLEVVVPTLLDWLDKNKVTGSDPLCGSSVHFDRSMLHEWIHPIFKRFSYRNIDVSTVKELCMRFDAATYTEVQNRTKPQKRHRVSPDIDDSIEELKAYFDNFFLGGVLE